MIEIRCRVDVQQVNGKAAADPVADRPVFLVTSPTEKQDPSLINVEIGGVEYTVEAKDLALAVRRARGIRRSIPYGLTRRSEE